MQAGDKAESNPHLFSLIFATTARLHPQEHFKQFSLAGNVHFTALPPQITIGLGIISTRSDCNYYPCSIVLETTPNIGCIRICEQPRGPSGSSVTTGT